MNTPLSSCTWCAHTSRMWRLPVANTDLHSCFIQLYSPWYRHSASLTDPLTISPPVNLSGMLMFPFCPLLTIFHTSFLFEHSVARHIVGYKEVCDGDANIMGPDNCYHNVWDSRPVWANGSPCQPSRPPTVTPLSHYLMATWDDVKNLLCGQELHNDVTSPHHITSNVRMLTLPLHDFYSSVSTEPFLLSTLTFYNIYFWSDFLMWYQNLLV